MSIPFSFSYEGAIKYVQEQYPDLKTNARRLPRILEELDRFLKGIENSCSLDGALHISDLVFYEEVLEVDNKELLELNKYSRVERGQILQVLREHLPQPRVVSPQEIQSLRALFNPRIRPDDRDASLIVVACHLAANAEPVVVLTSDPDFTDPVKSLVRRRSVTLGRFTFPTNQIMHRHYFSFMRKFHDCCNLPSEIYEVLGNTYLGAQLQRLPNLRKDVMKRVVGELQELQIIHAKAVQYKCAMV